MEISQNVEDACLTVFLTGRLDTNTSPVFEKYLIDNLEGINDLVIDLIDVQYVSSAGLRVIMFAQKHMMKCGGTLVVRHPNEYINDVFEATGFSEILTIEL